MPDRLVADAFPGLHGSRAHLAILGPILALTLFAAGPAKAQPSSSMTVNTLSAQGNATVGGTLAAHGAITLNGSVARGSLISAPNPIIAADGLNLQNGTFSDAAIRSPGFAVNPNGSVSSNSGFAGPASVSLGGDGSYHPFLYYYPTLSGTNTGSTNAMALIGTSSDTAAFPGGGLTGLNIQMNSGGTATTGNRLGLGVMLNFTGGPTNKRLGTGSEYGALFAYANAGGNLGGTSGANYGQLWGGVISGVLTPTASYWTNDVGLEVDFGNQGTTSVPYLQGLKIVLQNGTNQPAQASDYFLSMSGDATGGLPGAGISFGSPDGFWAWGPHSSLITAGILPNHSLRGYPGPARVAGLGVDFSAVNFSTGAFKSKGFLVDGSGHVSAAGLTVVPAAPARSSAPCTPGQIAVDSAYVYVCTGPNAWKRAALASW